LGGRNLGTIITGVVGKEDEILRHHKKEREREKEKEKEKIEC